MGRIRSSGRIMNGSNAPLWFKILALCTAVGLGGAYVWKQQQKAPATQVTPKKVEADQRMVISGSKSAVIDTAPVAEEKTQTNQPEIQQVPKTEERVMMPGSKSGIITPQPQAPELPKQRTMLPGSKSRPILEPIKEDKP
jgi:hypothetical protein